MGAQSVQPCWWPGCSSAEKKAVSMPSQVVQYSSGTLGDQRGPSEPWPRQRMDRGTGSQPKSLIWTQIRKPSLPPSCPSRERLLNTHHVPGTVPGPGDTGETDTASIFHLGKKPAVSSPVSGAPSSVSVLADGPSRLSCTPSHTCLYRSQVINDLSIISDSASGQERNDSCSGIQLFNRDHQGSWETHKRNLLHFFIEQVL